MKKPMIKSIKKLPAWYKLENYQAASTLDVQGWYSELIIRFFLKENITPDQKSKTPLEF